MKTISRTLYPFEGKRFDRGGGIRMHWLDEGPASSPGGGAEPVVMVHGNPSWSLYYRSLVVALRDRHRCIVPDHVGMGLSDKPGDADYDYTLESRIDDLDRLLEHAGVTRDVTLVVHDWGGGIGFGWATRHPERVKRLVILNTAAFHLPGGKTFPPALALTRTPLGSLLVRGANAFARGTARIGVKKGSMSRELREAYAAPYDDWDARIATLRFVQDIPLRPGDRAYARITKIAEGLEAFRATPALVCWGMRDFVFDRHFLEEWQRRLPHAEVHRFEDAGHYVLEDEGDAITSLVRRFIDAHPLSRETAVSR